MDVKYITIKEKLVENMTKKFTEADQSKHANRTT